jgi:apolipoprotein N-acyltransferase
MPYTSKKINSLLLSLFSAALLTLAWYWQLTILTFFAWVPLLLLEQRLSQRATIKAKYKLQVFGLSYFTFLLWNLGVTWWVKNASVEGALMAFLANSLLMAGVFVFYSNLKNKLNLSWGRYLLVPLWLAWEYGHTLWDISWTWLTLGNIFAFNHNWVQWYEFTGVSGGSAWILLINIVIFKRISKLRDKKFHWQNGVKVMAGMAIPIIFSYIILETKTPLSKTEKPINFTIVQPNIDPYNVKFQMDYQSQFLKSILLLTGKTNEKTDYLLFPETFITDNINEKEINQSEAVQWFKDSLLKKFPQLKIVTGGNTYQFYENENDKTLSSRKDDESGKYYDAYNTALQIDNNGSVQIYHKSKLVPGVEQMPFPALLKPLENMAIDMGGTSGSLGKQNTRENFTSATATVAPVVCYESVYGDYITEYIRKGAGIITIITNDGWWDDTPGYIQHLNFARLRAIENRRQIARCANTGTSCFIDEFGNISQATDYWKEAVISQQLYSNSSLTFFSRFGDLISYASVMITLILIVFRIWLRFKPKEKTVISPLI